MFMTFPTYYWHFDKLVDSWNVCICVYVWTLTTAQPYRLLQDALL